MREHGAAIHRHCLRVLRSRSLADDVHQTVFVEAFRDLDTVSDRTAFRPWLYAIANHRCLDALKVSRRWYRRFLHREELPVVPDPAPSGEERAAARSATEAIEECLDKLQPHVRIAVILRYQEGFTFEEMAGICRERPATLQARVARALPLLRRCLEARGIEP
jgi:RNA polymerase sigma-70 factor (ECF subfamily)